MAGLTFEELVNYPARLQTVDATDIQTLLASCVGREVATIVGPKTQELGGDATWVDWRAQAVSLGAR